MSPFLQAAFVELQKQGVNVAPTIVTHVAPLGWEHIGLTGDYVWTDAEQPSDGVLRPPGSPKSPYHASLEHT